MAWTGVDNFESYTSGNDLNGGSGGSGWSGNWTATATNVKIQTGTVYEGSQAADIDATSGEATAVRTITGTSSGSLYIAMRKDVVGNTGFSVSILDGANTLGYVSFHTDGNIKMYYTTGWTTNNLTTYSAGQWYVINIEWDDTAQPDKYRVRVHDGTSWGSYSSWLATLTATYSTVDRVRVANNASPSTGTSYFDVVTDTDPTATSSTPTRTLLGVGT